MNTRIRWVKGKKGRLSMGSYGDLSFTLNPEKKPCRVVITLNYLLSQNNEDIEELMREIMKYAEFNEKDYKIKKRLVRKIKRLVHINGKLSNEKRYEVAITIHCESLGGGKGVAGRMREIMGEDAFKEDFKGKFKIKMIPKKIRGR